ncbi:hypothetical protein DR999_PMT08008 [Platysternon megacephalum]|uniref:Uncharacterized protein n=1 Tax=Platysternon megacephalum TaxID=55544 RepID=A0A4D9EG20_9SAUR|nr:hypothetical protein DR999_PMT08008 [Platysternon megacephalum]
MKLFVIPHFQKGTGDFSPIVLWVQVIWFWSQILNWKSVELHRLIPAKHPIYRHMCSSLYPDLSFPQWGFLCLQLQEAGLVSHEEVWTLLLGKFPVQYVSWQFQECADLLLSGVTARKAFSYLKLCLPPLPLQPQAFFLEVSGLLEMLGSLAYSSSLHMLGFK